MLALLKAILLLPVALIVILLAIANRTPVVFSFDPFARGAPELAASVPLYLLLLGALALGVLLGGVGAWLTAGRQRRSGRASRREATPTPAGGRPAAHEPRLDPRERLAASGRAA